MLVELLHQVLENRLTDCNTLFSKCHAKGQVFVFDDCFFISMTTPIMCHMGKMAMILSLNWVHCTTRFWRGKENVMHVKSLMI